ncbi:MAG TPA: hypothetical protein VNW90_23100 [Acetobacteraceae bacterium]|jgi:hypothetical protein|nr:hypothetical protein [Acetobacteraceae bacterium]
MTLGLKAYHTGGTFTARYEYNAKSGRISRVDRTADNTGTIKVDITASLPMFAWDVASIEIGWVNFQAGAAPSFTMVPFGQPMPARPDGNHKAGFRSKVWDGREAMVREFSSTAGATVNAIEELWDVLVATPEAAAGRVPVIQLAGVVPITGRNGTNYAPRLVLIQWIERDAAIFGPRTVAAPGAAPIAPPVLVAPQPAQWQAAPVAAPVVATWPVAA